MKIAQRVEKILPSLTLEITALAKKMKQEGRSVINFAAGEPDFDTPDYIKEAAIRAIKEGFTKYTPSSGILELKQSICQKLAQDNHLNYSPAQIVVCSGAKHAIYNILQALCNKGEEVIISSPYWVSYPEMVTLAQAKVRLIPTNEQTNFKIYRESLKRNITKKTKLLILNSPANPTGCVYSRKELIEIAELAVEHNLYVLSDEVYEKLIFDGREHVSIGSLNKQIFALAIVVNGVSKSYAMTGWRIGYLASYDEQIVQAINKLQDHSTSNPCSISQRAALAALSRTSDNQMQLMVKEFQLRRDCMLNGLKQIANLSFFKPEGAFYVFCNIAKTGLDSMTFTQRLLKEAEVSVIPGKAFGRDDYIRLSFATSIDQIKEGMRRLKDWSLRLKA